MRILKKQDFFLSISLPKKNICWYNFHKFPCLWHFDVTWWKCKKGILTRNLAVYFLKRMINFPRLCSIGLWRFLLQINPHHIILSSRSLQRILTSQFRRSIATSDGKIFLKKAEKYSHFLGSLESEKTYEGICFLLLTVTVPLQPVLRGGGQAGELLVVDAHPGDTAGQSHDLCKDLN